MTGARRGLALAALAGALSFAGCFVADAGPRWAAGVAFGLLVLGPTRREPARAAALVALTVAVYRAAVWIAMRLAIDASVPAVAACALAGAAGALALSLGAAAVAGEGVARAATARAALAGALAGAAIGIAVDAESESFAQYAFLLLGFVGWQVGYTAAHRLAPWPAAAHANA